jgi:hypothetical protein
MRNVYPFAHNKSISIQRKKKAIGSRKNSRDFLKKIFNGRHGRCVFGLRSVIDAEIKDEIAFEIVDYFAEHIEKQQASYRAIFRLQVKKKQISISRTKNCYFFKIPRSSLVRRRGVSAFIRINGVLE